MDHFLFSSSSFAIVEPVWLFLTHCYSNAVLRGVPASRYGAVPAASAGSREQRMGLGLHNPRCKFLAHECLFTVSWNLAASSTGKTRFVACDDLNYHLSEMCILPHNFVASFCEPNLYRRYNYVNANCRITLTYSSTVFFWGCVNS